MDPDAREKIEHLLEEAPSRFPFPETPQIRLRQEVREARRTSRAPRLAWVVALIILLLAAALAVPPVRAAVLEFIQLGAIRIFLNTPPEPIAPTPISAIRSTPSPVGNEFLAEMVALGGDLPLDEAAEQAGFPIPLPDYPPGIGRPDRVIYERLEGGHAVFLIWMDDRDPQSVQMSLILLGRGAYVGKDTPATIEEVTIVGLPGLWVTGRHTLILRDNGLDRVISVDGNVLIWEENGITYRLELKDPLDEALRIAESLEP